MHIEVHHRASLTKGKKMSVATFNKRSWNKAYKVHEAEMQQPTAEWEAVLDQFCPSRDADIAAAEAQMDAEIKAATEKFKAIRAARMAQFDADVSEARAKFDAESQASWNRNLKGLI